jgi:hypothetical protein
MRVAGCNLKAKKRFQKAFLTRTNFYKKRLLKKGFLKKALTFNL